MRPGRSHIEDGYEIMQYTGLADAEGADIYEGDIAQHFGEVVIVHYSEDECGYSTTPVGGGETVRLSAYQLEEGHATVIGNRYEDGDLMAKQT